MGDLVKLCATRSVIPTGAPFMQICAFVHRVQIMAAWDMGTSKTLTTRLVMLSARETTVMTRQNLSSFGTGLVIVTDVQTQEERPQKIISVAKSYRQF